MVPTPEEGVEFAGKRGGCEKAAGKRHRGEHCRARIREILVQVEQGRHDEQEARYLTEEERAASQPEADEPQIYRFHLFTSLTPKGGEPQRIGWCAAAKNTPL
jgi:hypothetical protein